MKALYQPYLPLTAGQRKLLCFMATITQRIDTRILGLYAKAEDLTQEQVKKTLHSLTSFFDQFYYFRDEYQLAATHIAPLLVYLAEEQPQWISHFDVFFKRIQSMEQRQLMLKIRACLKGEKVMPMRELATRNYCRMLVPLASFPKFFSLMRDIPHFIMMDFVCQVAIWQIEHDIADPDNMLGQIAKLSYPSLSTVDSGEMNSIVSLYDFYKQGRYDTYAASFNNLFSHLLVSAKALYDGNFETAFKQMNQAMRDYNKACQPSEKGYFNMALNNLMLVLAYHLYTPDEHKKLSSLLKKDNFRLLATSKSVVWMAQYLMDAIEPSGAVLRTELRSDVPLRQYLALMAARFFHIDVELPENLPAEPATWLLRTELSGKAPSLLSRIGYKQKWERLLEELTPKDDKIAATQEVTSRVAYVFHLNWVELREQSRLKSGEWGAGKKFSMDAFKRGTPFMDDTDRRIAATISGGYYSYDLTIEKVLPFLINSDRVYTGVYAPLMPVAIVEEKPYLIIERGKTGFTLKSNISNAKLDGSTIYRKESDTYYTVITMTSQQRNYYRRLLEVGTFPLEAEQQLREFLPKVSNVVEVHSDLVEGGTTLEHRDGTGLLCLQVLPSISMQNAFDLCCYARPLPNGPTLLTPGKGLNPCVAEEDGVRYQTTRDMKGERANLQVLCTFIEDNDLADNPDDNFAIRTPITLTPEGLLQLMEFIQTESERFYLEWPEGGQLRLKSPNTSAWNISLRSNSGWFEVEGEIPIDDDTVLSTSQLLKLVAENTSSGFIRLNDTDFLRISDKLRKQLQRIESLTVSDHGHLHISPLHASLLGSVLSGEVEVKHDKKIDELQKQIKKSMAQQPEVPKQLKAELRDYQIEGFQWMARMTGWEAGVCLADDMGLGKTVQTIAFMLYVAQEGPSLVAAPASVVLNWQREIQRFAPTLNVVVLNSATDRHVTIDSAGKHDVLLTTYGLFVTEADDLEQKQWNTVCLDEAHVIKNRETKTSAAVMKLQARHRIILTGTPVQNHLGELWNLYQFINPELLGSYDQFQKKYIIPIEQQQNKARSRQLKRIVQPFILRRTKQEVIEELPDKTEIQMPVELSDDELAVYEVIRRRAKQLLEEEQDGPLSVNTLSEITRLRQAACAAQLVAPLTGPKGNGKAKGLPSEAIEGNWGDMPCSKINTLLSLLEEIVGGGNSVLVFSQFTSFLTMVRDAIKKTPSLCGERGEPLYLDGTVPMKKREQLVQSFQRGEHPIFLISLKAGGLGLNLTGANYVIHLDPWWNPAIEQQATDRAYRIGQRQNVTVYHLISQHTIEEKILRLHETKRNLADAMLQGTNESHKLTSKELMEMIGGK